MKWHNLLLKTHSARNGGVWGPKFEEIWVPSALRLHLKLLFVGSKCVCVGVVGRLCDARDQQYLLSYKTDIIWNLLKWWWFLVKMLTNVFLVPWSSGSQTGFAILNTLFCDPLQYSEYIDNLLGSVLVSFLLRKLNKTQGGSTKYNIPGRAHKTESVVVGLLFPIWGSLYCNTALWLLIENGWISNGWISLLSWVSWWRHLQNYVDEASIPSFASQSVSLWTQTLKISYLRHFLSISYFHICPKVVGNHTRYFCQLVSEVRKIRFCNALLQNSQMLWNWIKKLFPFCYSITALNQIPAERSNTNMTPREWAT